LDFKQDMIDALSTVSLETTIAHGDQEIAITPKLGGRI